MRCFNQYLAMKPGLGWMHIKDYRHPEPAQRVGHVDEDALKHFVPADLGDSGHEAILRDFAAAIPGSNADSSVAAFPACSSTWNRTSKAADSSAASAAPTASASLCVACAALWIMSASSITCGTSTTSWPPAACDVARRWCRSGGP